MSQILKYIDSSGGIIKSDLKRLKKIRSLKEDVHNMFSIKIGLIDENPNHYCQMGGSCFGDFITLKKIQDKSLYFYKDRLATTDPFSSPSNGVRVLFCVIKEDYSFFPVVIYSAKEENDWYVVNGKRLKPTEGNLPKIITEKINSLEI